MTLSEDVQRMILSALESMEVTSANPTHINRLIQVNNLDIGNLDATLKAEIERVIKETQSKEDTNISKLSTDRSDNIKIKKDVKQSSNKLRKLDQGNVGELTRMSSEQMGNIKSFAANPAGFLMGSLMRKFAKGAGVLLLVVLISEAVKFIIAELLKPGRLLDIRFKRNIHDEVLAFRRREEKQKLKQGFARVIITSQPRLRGANGAAQTFDTNRAIARGDPIFPNDTFMTNQPKGQPMSFKWLLPFVFTMGLR